MTWKVIIDQDVCPHRCWPVWDMTGGCHCSLSEDHKLICDDERCPHKSKNPSMQEMKKQIAEYELSRLEENGNKK